MILHELRNNVCILYNEIILFASTAKPFADGFIAKTCLFLLLKYILYIFYDKRNVLSSRRPTK